MGEGLITLGWSTQMLTFTLEAPCSVSLDTNRLVFVVVDDLFFL